MLNILPYWQFNNNKEKGANRGNNLFSWKWWRINIINSRPVKSISFSSKHSEKNKIKQRRMKWDLNVLFEDPGSAPGACQSGGF